VLVDSTTLTARLLQPPPLQIVLCGQSPARTRVERWMGSATVRLPQLVRAVHNWPVPPLRPTNTVVQHRDFTLAADIASLRVETPRHSLGSVSNDCSASAARSVHQWLPSHIALGDETLPSNVESSAILVLRPPVAVEGSQVNQRHTRAANMRSRKRRPQRQSLCHRQASRSAAQ
jgi:hypothetical protein